MNEPRPTTALSQTSAAMGSASVSAPIECRRDQSRTAPNDSAI
jgi:hypothetical protein